MKVFILLYHKESLIISNILGGLYLAVESKNRQM